MALQEGVTKFNEGYYGKIGSISSTRLGMEDHGLFTFCLMFDFGGDGQGFTGYSLDEPFKDADGEFIRRRGCAAGMDLIMRIMAAVGAEDWGDLQGKTAYALYEKETCGWGNDFIMGIRSTPGLGGNKRTPLWIPDWRREWFGANRERRA